MPVSAELVKSVRRKEERRLGLRPPVKRRQKKPDRCEADIEAMAWL